MMPCQSRFSRKSIDDIVKLVHDRMSATIKKCLGDNRMSITDERAKQAFSELESIIRELYSKELSPRLHRRARHEYRAVKRLQQLLRQRPDIIICQMDKTPGFYIGNTSTIGAKVQEYMATTKAYQEITDGHCPLADNLRATQTLLNYLFSQRAITKEQHNKLLPDLNQLELAHLHALPKVHKVKLFSFILLSSIYTFFCFFTAAHTNTTYCSWYQCTYFENVRIFESTVSTHLSRSCS